MPMVFLGSAGTDGHPGDDTCRLGISPTVGPQRDLTVVYAACSVGQMDVLCGLVSMPSELTPCV